MGGRGSGSSAPAPQIASFKNIQPTAQMAASANNAVFPSTDPNGFRDLKNGRQYYTNQNLTIDQQISAINYLSPDTTRGSLYSMSQNMNYKLANGQKLTANEQYVYDNMMGSMHNLGQNTNLTRYDHPAMINNLLQQSGLTRSYENYTEAQLQKALVGVKYGENKLVSTSYNDFKNAPSASTFTSRGVKINYKAKASTQAMMPGDGYVNVGGRMVRNSLGEVVLADSGSRKNYEIIGVRYNGKMARRQGTQSYSMPQVEIDVLVD